MQAQCGLIGKDLSQSLSPFIHSRAQELLKKQVNYQVFPLKKSQLEKFLKEFWEKGGLGLNVTAPYKEDVAKILNSPCKSVNTLWRGENFWSSASTDIEGLELFLASEKKSLFSFNSLFCLGAGGVVTALRDYLHKFSSKPLKINYFSRQVKATEERLSQKSQFLRQKFFKFCPETFAKELAKEKQKSLVIQASSADLKDLKGFIEKLSPLKTACLDLNYGEKAFFFDKLQSRQAWQADGLQMLIYQALLAQQKWWPDEKKLKDKALAQKILKELKKNDKPS